MKKKLFLLWDRFVAWQNRGGLKAFFEKKAKAFFAVVTYRDGLWSVEAATLICGLAICICILNAKWETVDLLIWFPAAFSILVAFVYRKKGTMVGLFLGIFISLFVWLLMVGSGNPSTFLLDTKVAIFSIGITFPFAHWAWISLSGEFPNTRWAFKDWDQLKD